MFSCFQINSDSTLIVYHRRMQIRVGEVVRVTDQKNNKGDAMYAKVVWFGRYKVRLGIRPLQVKQLTLNVFPT